MGKLLLLLTADYEVFGNGSGSVENCLIQPAEELMKICEAFSTRITYFVDVCELWAFEETEKTGLFEKDYRPATGIKSQLQDALRRGHDIQLHFHPQWLEYKYLGNEKWELNYDYWRLPDVPNGYGNKEDEKSLLGLFTKGKNYLEHLLKPVNPEYKCKAFRAGAWCIQPEQKVLKAIKEVGIQYDSTVAPGTIFNDGLTRYDFTNAPDGLPYWKVGTTLHEIKAGSELIEMPIFTTKVAGNKNFKHKLLKLSKRVPLGPSACKGIPASVSYPKIHKDSKLQKLKKAMSTQYKMFDFCGGATAEEMQYMIQQAKFKYGSFLKNQDVPIVAIGHPKVFGNGKELNKFLQWTLTQRYIQLEPIENISFWQN